jgi:hypothetical protein
MVDTLPSLQAIVFWLFIFHDTVIIDVTSIDLLSSTGTFGNALTKACLRLYAVPANPQLKQY